VGSVLTTIEVDATGAIGPLEEMLTVVKELATEFGDLKDKMAGGMDASGPGKMAEQMSAAADTIGGAAEAIAGKLASLGASVDSVAGQFASLGDAGKGIADIGAGIGSATDELKGMAGAAGDAGKGLASAADASKGLADTSAASADASRVAADAYKTQASAAADLAAAQGAAADTGKAAAETQAVSAAVSRDAAGRYTASTAAVVEQDAAAAESASARKAATADAGAAAEGAAKKYEMLALGGVALGAVSIDMASKYQTSTDRLVTSAGEQAKNLGMVRSGLLDMSVATDTSAANLSAGAYYAESAGFHGARALGVTKAAAEGAQAEGADLPTVTNALTTVLTDYGMTSSNAGTQGKLAIQGMNEIIAAVGQGKMTTQGLAGALPQVLPTAKLAHLSLPQVLGSLAQMTAEGMSPDQAAQDLSHTIGHVQTQTQGQSSMLQMLGINPNQLSTSMGKQGISGVVGEVDSAIAKHTDPKTGMVSLDVMNQSKLAVQSAREAIGVLPKSLQSVAEGYLTGKVSRADWYGLTGTKSTLPATDVNLLNQFGTIANKAMGLSDLVKSGMGDKITQSAALKAAMGDATGQKTAAMLGGENLQDTKDKVDAVGASAKHTGDNIDNWNLITKQFGFQLGSAEQAVKAIGIEAGTALLPDATTALHGLGDIGSFLAKNQQLTKELTIGLGGLGGIWAAGKIFSGLSTAAGDVAKVADAVGIPGAGKVSSILGKSAAAAPAAGADAASGGLDGVAGAARGAAGALDGLAGSAGKAGAAANEQTAGETRAGAAGTKEAYGETAAGNAGKGEAFGETEAGAAGKREAIGEEAGGAGGGGIGKLATQVAIVAIAADMVDSQLENKKNEKVLGNTNPSSWFNSFPGSEHAISKGYDWVAGGDPITAALAKAQAAQDRGNLADLGSLFAPPAKAPATDAFAGDMLKVGQKTPAVQTVSVKVKPEVDTSSISETLKHAMSSLGTGSAMTPVKVPAPDLSALATAKAKASADMAGVIAAMKSSAGGASGIGAGMDSGLAAGISGGAGQAIAAAHAVASEAAAAMSTALDAHSPSRVTMAIGQDAFDGGFAKGIDDGAGTVKAAASGLSKAAAASLLAGLQGGASAIQTAHDLAAGVAAPFTDSTIAGTITTAEDDVAAALKKGKISKAEDSGIVAWLKADAGKLQKLAQQRSVLENQITTAENYAQSITAGANQGASIVTMASNAQALEAGNAPAAVAPPQIADLISGMQAQVQSTKQFTGDLAKLKKEGLNSPELDQLAQSGAATGDPIAQSILSGGKGAITQLNQLQSQMNAAAKQLGITASNAVYEPASDIGKGVAAGLKSQLGAVNSSIGVFSKDITQALSAALGGGAGAAAFADGASLGKQLAAGLSSVSGDLTSALLKAIDTAEKDATKKRTKGSDGSSADGLASSVPGGSGAQSQHPAAAVPHPASAVPSGGGYGGGGGGPAVTHQTTTNLVVDGQAMATVVQQHILERTSNNPQSQWGMPGHQV
jgi:Phage-related minor tail protein